MSAGTTPTARGGRETPALPREQHDDKGGNGHAAAQPAAAHDPERGQLSDTARALRAARRFCYGLEPAPKNGKEPTWMPAALWPYRDAAHVRTGFPLLLDVEEGGRATPLADWLEGALEGLASGGRDVGVVRDNARRVELIARRVASSWREPAVARAALGELARALTTELGARHAPVVDATFTALAEELPAGAVLAPLLEGSDLQLLLHAARAQLVSRRAELRAELEGLAGRLETQLEVERLKQPDARGADVLARAVGVGDHLDASALAGVLGGHRGTETMSAERRARVEATAKALRSFLAEEPPVLVVVAAGDGAAAVSGAAGVEARRAAAVVDGAARAFDEIGSTFSKALKAARVARLELETPRAAYDAELHGPVLDAFDWRSFTREELAALPAVVALLDAEEAGGAALAPLARLLSSGRRVQALVRVRPALAAASSSSSDPASLAAFDLGMLAMGQGRALVAQSSAARPRHFLAACKRALAAPRASLLVVDESAGGDAAFLCSGAAIESRAHPLYRFDPDEGEGWARGLALDDEQPLDADWPAVGASGGGGGFAFTFADYALLEPRLCSSFAPVPDACAESAEILPLDRYLALADGEAAHKVPCVNAVDEGGEPVRLMVTRALALAARERLRAWHALLELSGVKSEHVDRAVAAATAVVEERMRKEREGAEAALRDEIERTRETAAAEALHRLAAGLVELDVAALAGSGGGAAARAVSTTAATAPAPTQTLATGDTAPASASAAAPAAAADDDGGLSFDEPAIDSALCTSCNDCITLNPLLFVYDKNKQARIGDATKGTFKELVEAAKKCPAKCIHPGKPLNKSEPDLERLMREAEPFN